MPPRKASRGTSKSTATPKKRVAANGFKLPDPIPSGQIITDVAKNDWVLGKSIGQGGFGEIYLASDDISRRVSDTDKFVVKVEPHSNGPLFTEMHCYMRIAKPELIEAWMKENKLKRFGMPKYLGSGSFEYKSQKYRFMVMERFGSDLQKILEQHSKKFSFKTVYQLGLEIIDVLEYIHDKGYIHADIKASNLLVGYQKGTENQVFLVDYGLACRYAVDGVHKEYKYDGRKAHDGTIEFTSRDAHIGAHSRRGDLEILGYNMTQWLCARLPWEDNLTDCDYVAKSKRWYMEHVDKLMVTCFPDGCPPGLQEFLTYVAKLTFDEKPNYEKCRQILRNGLVKRGYKDDGKLVFMSATPKQVSKKPKSRLNKVSSSTKESHSDVSNSPSTNGNDEDPNESVDMFEDSVSGDGENEIQEVAAVSTPTRPSRVKRAKPTVTPSSGKRSTPRARIRDTSSTPECSTSSGTGSRRRSSKAQQDAAPGCSDGGVMKSTAKRSKGALAVKKGEPVAKKMRSLDSNEEEDMMDCNDVDISESPGTDELEKENKSQCANIRVRRSRKIVYANESEDEDEREDFKPVYKPKPKPKSRVAAAKVKKAPVEVPSDPYPENLGLDNPTPAMLEQMARKNAKLAAKKK